MLRKETGNENLRSKMASPLSPAALFKVSIVRPMKLLFFSPIVLALSTYMAVVYGYLYLLFTTITEVYEGKYHFSQGTVGLTYLGIGVGSLSGVVIFGFLSDKILKAKSKSGEMKPEYRLPPMIPGSFIIPIGCKYFTQYTTHSPLTLPKYSCTDGQQTSTSSGWSPFWALVSSDSVSSLHSCPSKLTSSMPSPSTLPPPLQLIPSCALWSGRCYLWLDKRCTRHSALAGGIPCWLSLRSLCVRFPLSSISTARGSGRVQGFR